MEGFAEWRLVDLPVIPGTHHSGVVNPRKRTSAPVWGWAKCQDLGIEEQLHLGVRFFDLRVRVIPKEGEVMLSHGLTSDTSLADALEVIHDFLVGRPTEGVILYIRADKWHGMDADSVNVLSKTLTGASVQLVTFPDEPESVMRRIRVKEVAGRALIVAPRDILSDDVSAVPPSVLQYVDIWQEGSIEDAKNKIENYLETRDGVTGSGVFGGVALDGTFPIRQQSQTSKELNEWFIREIQNRDELKRKIQVIVLIDFASFEILSYLISINYEFLKLSNST